MIRAAATALALLTAFACAGCDTSAAAPADKGVCWTMTPGKGGRPDFHQVAAGIPDLEHCAAALETIRLRFLRMGGTHSELDGAYQGQFLFVQKEGVFTAATLNAAPYPALVRTGDGRLAVPGAVRQPQ